MTQAAPSKDIQHPPCPDQPLPIKIEALLLASERPLPDGRLVDLLGIGGNEPKTVATTIRQAIEELNTDYERTGRSFRAQRLAGGWQLMTLPAFGPLLERLHHQRQELRLSQPALETLSIIAYRQPVMRAEIEAIRGVACGEVLRSLLERRLIKIAGRAEQLGRPMLYGTSPQFLKIFGLPGLEALPPLEDASAATDAEPPAD